MSGDDDAIGGEIETPVKAVLSTEVTGRDDPLPTMMD
jgi:hypothetical protein